MAYFFNIVYGIAILFCLPWLIIRSIRTGRYQAGWKEKFFGYVPKVESANSVVWLHAVSVGEVQLLWTLVAGIEKRYPSCSLCISTTTQAGMEIAERAFSKHTVFYLPLDFTWSVRQAMKRIQPKLLVLVELEVWPNLIRAAKRAGCAVVIVNGRLSKRSFEGYRRFRWLIRPYFAMLDFVATQDADYATRFEAMGVAKSRVLSVGNLKFDGACPDRAHSEVVVRKTQLCLATDDVVWVVGSTQAPEEQYALDVFRKIKPTFPKLKLIVVPRQPDRFDEVGRLLATSGFKVDRRSQREQSSSIGWEILLGDTVGELRWWWGLADIAFVGGSFGDRGGQNMIEPAAFGVSTAVGPNTKNFADIIRILRESQAITQLDSPEDLYTWAVENLTSEEHRRSIGTRASHIAAEHRGALEKTLDALSHWCTKPAK
ncbi:MAG: 3-deoxy-D-manno-octulosonic acid transferase [Pirellulaceae bacterium]|nr:3-deoxy-D-manno-octulosonic acid transferase [Pirellulaceae bacterium]